MKENHYGLSVITFIFIIIVSGLSGAFIKKIIVNDTLSYILSLVTTYLLGYAPAIIWFYKNKKEYIIIEPFKQNFKEIRRNIITIIISMLILLIISFVLGQIFHDLEPNTTVNIINKSSLLGKTILFVFICIIAPLFEEIYFRYFVSGLYTGKVKIISIILSTVIFLLVHGSVYNSPFYIALSIFTLISTHKNKNTIYSTALHSLSNTIMFVLSLFK